MIGEGTRSRRCAGGALETKLEDTESWLDIHVPVKSYVGYGVLGTSGFLGFEGRCVNIEGMPQLHSLGTHPPSFGKSFVEYDIAGDNEEFHYKRLYVRVGINDENNYMETAGSPLRFVLVGDDNVLWSSKGIRRTKQYQTVLVDCSGVKKLQLEVHANSNACAHAVWIDPMLISEAVNEVAGTALSHLDPNKPWKTGIPDRGTDSSTFERKNDLRLRGIDPSRGPGTRRQEKQHPEMNGS